MANIKGEGAPRAISKEEMPKLIDGEFELLQSDRQDKLIDHPRQRMVYARLRGVAAELCERWHDVLEPMLSSALNSLLASLPEQFEDARVGLVYNAGERLRLLIEAQPSPDEAMSNLPGVGALVEARLATVVQLYNAFDFNDEGLSARYRTIRGPEESDLVLSEEKLVSQLKSFVGDSVESKRFDAANWLARWLREPLPALGGVTPLSLLDTTEGYEQVSNVLARMQSGAYA